MNNYFMGYDPGRKDGVVVVTSDYMEVVESHPFKEISDYKPLKAWLSQYEISFGCLEYVTGRVVPPQIRAAYVEAMLIELEIPYSKVSPAKWQRPMLEEYFNYRAPAGSNAATKKRYKKERSVLLCNSRWPKLDLDKKQHDLADSILLSRFGMRQWRDR